MINDYNYRSDLPVVSCAECGCQDFLVERITRIVADVEIRNEPGFEWPGHSSAVRYQCVACDAYVAPVRKPNDPHVAGKFYTPAAVTEVGDV